MINKQQTGVILNHTAASNIVSGQVVVIGDRIGVAITDIANGAEGALLTEGVAELPKDASVLAQGAQLYWTGTALTTDADDGGDPVVPYVKAGFAAAPALTGAATALVKLNA